MTARQYPRILAPPKGNFFLYGVRGVGKITWAREIFPDAHIIDLLDESRYQAMLANEPDGFERWRALRLLCEDGHGHTHSDRDGQQRGQAHLGARSGSPVTARTVARNRT